MELIPDIKLHDIFYTRHNCTKNGKNIKQEEIPSNAKYISEMEIHGATQSTHKTSLMTDKLEFLSSCKSSREKTDQYAHQV